MKKVNIPCVWTPTMSTGTVVGLKANGYKYVVKWDDEPGARSQCYDREDIKSGELVIGKNVRLLYGRKEV